MRLKKVISAVLLFLILFSNLGLAVNVHYCHNKMASVSLGYQVEEACVIEEKDCCAAQKDHKDCCSDSVVKAEKETATVLARSHQSELSFFVLSTVCIPDFFSVAETIVQQKWFCFYCDSHAPPLYKLYCQYLFYV